jgi:polyhydroxyalkanoate depolymerase
VQALAAAAIMAATNHRAQPRSMTLMAGPIDTRVNPTAVNRLASERPIEWFERTLIATVPLGQRGGGRRVYPGFVQLAAFMSMNFERHLQAHVDLFEHLAAGDHAKAEAIKTFYDEYFAVLDLPAEFYLETVQRVFQEAHLAEGRLEWHGHPVDPRAIRRTALLTVEGERDNTARSARRSPRTTSAPASGPTGRSTTCSPAPATTACSAAGAGRARSTRWCAT